MISTNRKAMSLVELMMVIAIAGVLLTTASMAGFNVYQNSIDNGIRGDLQTLSNATTGFMTDTNGVAPCFTPESGEGTAAAGICANSGYDYVQGRIAENLDGDAETDVNLDYDATDGEAFTFNDILVPTYLDALPDARRAGQVYVYTKGNPTTNEGSSAFAYSAVLSGPKAKEIINGNISVINTLGLANLGNTDRPAACTAAQVEFDSAGVALALGDKASAAVSLETDATKNYNYYSYTSLIDSTGATGTAFVQAECDVYSVGQGLRIGNFTQGLSAANQSVGVTVNFGG